MSAANSPVARSRSWPLRPSREVEVQNLEVPAGEACEQGAVYESSPDRGRRRASLPNPAPSILVSPRSFSSSVSASSAAVPGSSQLESVVGFREESLFQGFKLLEEGLKSLTAINHPDYLQRSFIHILVRDVKSQLRSLLAGNFFPNLAPEKQYAFLEGLTSLRQLMKYFVSAYDTAKLASRDLTDFPEFRELSLYLKYVKTSILSADLIQLANKEQLDMLTSKQADVSLYSVCQQNFYNPLLAFRYLIMLRNLPEAEFVDYYKRSVLQNGVRIFPVKYPAEIKKFIEAVASSSFVRKRSEHWSLKMPLLEVSKEYLTILEQRRVYVFKDGGGKPCMLVTSMGPDSTGTFGKAFVAGDFAGNVYALKKFHTDTNPHPAAYPLAKHKTHITSFSEITKEWEKLLSAAKLLGLPTNEFGIFVVKEEGCVYLRMPLGHSDIYNLSLFLVNRNQTSHLRYRLLSLEIIKQIAKELAILAAHDFVHRDLKLENILLHIVDSPEADTGRLKQSSYFHMSDWASLTKKDNLSETLCFDIYSICPEVLRRQKLDDKLDVWALGNLLLEILVPGFRNIWGELSERYAPDYRHIEAFMCWREYFLQLLRTEENLLPNQLTLPQLSEFNTMPSYAYWYNAAQKARTYTTTSESLSQEFSEVWQKVTYIWQNLYVLDRDLGKFMLTKVLTPTPGERVSAKELSEFMKKLQDNYALNRNPDRPPEETIAQLCSMAIRDFTKKYPGTMHLKEELRSLAASLPR